MANFSVLIVTKMGYMIDLNMTNMFGIVAFDIDQ